MSPNSISNINSFNSTSYEFDYYSGSQIAVYIGDIWLDDVEAIQFSVSQSKQPVYGYGSQYFHTIAAGQVIVQGAFSIPFKESDYLLLTLQNYNAKIPPVSGNNEEGYKVGPENIEARFENRILRGRFERDRGDNPSTAEPVYLTTEEIRALAALPDNIFEGVAEEFEDALWQPKISLDFQTGNLTSRHVADNTYRRPDQYPSFDIWVLYGDIENKAANHTIRKIIQAQIVGHGQQISVGGDVIREQYQFIAQNLV